MEIIGTIKVINDTVRVSDKFQKREFVVTIDEATPYPQHIPFQASQDKCSQLDNFMPGQKVKVNYNLKGREWNGPKGTQYFLTLDAWRMEVIN